MEQMVFKNRIKEKGNKNILLQEFFILEKHYHRDKTRQMSQGNAQGVERIPVIEIFFVKVVKDFCKLVCNGKAKSHKANEKDSIKMNRNSSFYRCTGIAKKPKI